MRNSKKTLGLFLGILCLVLTACSKEDDRVDEQIVLEQWKAGAKVSLQSVNGFGIERCFTSMEIDDPVFSRMYKKSFKEDCTIPLEQLRYIKVLHYNLDKQICLGEMVCNKTLANDLIDIFKVLYNAQYPIEKMLLVDDYDADDEVSCADNNSSAFNFRLIAGTTRLSNHSTGRAVDINPRYNPYLKWLNEDLYFSPKNGISYIDRTADFPYKIDKEDLCLKEFTKRGFIWGGNWPDRKDYMHFEKPE